MATGVNTLYYGDNLNVLRAHVRDESVDLVYLDPPFNSNAGYNLLFKAAKGNSADASIEAFDDTWTWGEASQNALMDIDGGTNRSLQVMMRAMHDALGDSQLMAYLAMMAVRLVELHRVLKPSGSLYLHCDPTASAYLKLVLDAVFGVESFINEIVWKRTTAHSNVYRAFGDITDTIFFYGRSKNRTWNQGYRSSKPTDIERLSLRLTLTVDVGVQRTSAIRESDRTCTTHTMPPTASLITRTRTDGPSAWKRCSDSMRKAGCIFQASRRAGCERNFTLTTLPA